MIRKMDWEHRYSNLDYTTGKLSEVAMELTRIDRELTCMLRARKWMVGHLEFSTSFIVMDSFHLFSIAVLYIE